MQAGTSWRRRALQFGGIAVLGIGTAQAQSAVSGSQAQSADPGGQTAPADDPPSMLGPSWRVDLGVNVGIHPAYPGARRYGPTAMPDASINYKNRLSLGPDGLSLNILSVPGLSFGPVIGFMEGRDHKDAARLSGMGDIQPAIALGGFVRWRQGPYEIAAILRQAVTHSNYGLQASLRGNYHVRMSRDVELAFGPDLDFGNAHYEQTWFGVSQSQSAASGLAAYRAHGGLQDAGAHVRLSWHATPRWTLRTYAGAKQLLLDAADSPIVERQTEYSAGVGAGYRF